MAGIEAGKAAAIAAIAFWASRVEACEVSDVELWLLDGNRSGGASD